MTIACSGEAPVAVLVKMIFLGEEVDEKRNILDIANTGLCLPLHFASHLHSDPDVIKLLVRSLRRGEGGGLEPHDDERRHANLCCPGGDAGQPIRQQVQQLQLRHLLGCHVLVSGGAGLELTRGGE